MLGGKGCATNTPASSSFLTPLLAQAQQTLPPGRGGSAALAATHHSYLQQSNPRRARISSTSTTSRCSALSSSRPSSPQPQQDLSHVSGLIDRLLALLADDPQQQLAGTAEAALLQQLPHVAAAPAQSPCKPTLGGGTSSVGCQTTMSGSQADITVGRAEGRAVAYAEAHASLHGSRTLVERLLLLLHESQEQDGSDAAIRAPDLGDGQKAAAQEARASGGVHASTQSVGGIQEQALQKPLAESSGQVGQCTLAREDSCCSSSSLSTCSSLLFLKAAAAGAGDDFASELPVEAGVGAAAAGEAEAAGCMPVQPSEAPSAPAMAATAASATASQGQPLGLVFDRLASHQPQSTWPQEQQHQGQQQQQLQEQPVVQQQQTPMPQQQMLPLMQLQHEAEAAQPSHPWQHQQLICTNAATQQQAMQQQHSVAEQLQLAAITLSRVPGCCSAVSTQPGAATSAFSLSAGAGRVTGRNAVRLERLTAPLPPSVPSIEGSPQLSVGSASGAQSAALTQRGTTPTDQLDTVAAADSDSDTGGTSTGEQMRFCFANRKHVPVTR